MDACTALAQPRRGALVRAIDVDVVLPLPLAFEAVPQRLAVTLSTVSTSFQETAARLCQRDRVLARTGHARGLDEPLVAEVPKIASARTQPPIPVVAKITTGDHSKRADGRERPRLRAAQRVLTIAVAHDLALETAGQVQVARERLAGIEAALRSFAIALRPAGIIARIRCIAIRLPRVS